MARCPKSGLRVRFTGSPAAVAFYQETPYPYNRSPAPGEMGTTIAIPTGRGKNTCMPGPGGGMVYVDWDQAGIAGVLRVHMERAGKRRSGA